jgi:GNAT superfamily N-acetyltransferase
MLRIRIATEAQEFEQIHRLGYRTFVEEIPQHPSDGSGRRVDPFHEENSYVIALRDQVLVGMLAVRDRRPFSLDHKLDNLEGYLPSHRSPCEIRLLAVEPHHRHTRVVVRLVAAATRLCLDRGHDLALISGAVRQGRLYEKIGFVPFGPRVGTPEAPYQPMYLTAQACREARSVCRALGDETDGP